MSIPGGLRPQKSVRLLMHGGQDIAEAETKTITNTSWLVPSHKLLSHVLMQLQLIQLSVYVMSPQLRLEELGQRLLIIQKQTARLLVRITPLLDSWRPTPMLTVLLLHLIISVPMVSLLNSQSMANGVVHTVSFLLVLPMQVTQTQNVNFFMQQQVQPVPTRFQVVRPEQTINVSIWI